MHNETSILNIPPFPYFLYFLHRGPIWTNINYLALKALKHYGTRTISRINIIAELKKSSKKLGNSEKLNEVEMIQQSEKIYHNCNIQKNRSLLLYHNLRENIQNSILSSYNNTGFFWEHYEDVLGSGTRGHPFSGWTSLILNIMAEI